MLYVHFDHLETILTKKMLNKDRHQFFESDDKNASENSN